MESGNIWLVEFLSYIFVLLKCIFTSTNMYFSIRNNENGIHYPGRKQSEIFFFFFFFFFFCFSKCFQMFPFSGAQLLPHYCRRNGLAFKKTLSNTTSKHRSLPDPFNGYVFMVLGRCSEREVYNLRLTSLLFSPITIKSSPVPFISMHVPCSGYKCKRNFTRQLHYKSTIR